MLTDRRVCQVSTFLYVYLLFRGYVYTDNVDNAASECNLDDVTHDKVIINNGLGEVNGCSGGSSDDEMILNEQISEVIDIVNSKLGRSWIITSNLFVLLIKWQDIYITYTHLYDDKC